jgi:hypothetical protein
MNTNNVRVIAYENEKQGVYKYSIIRNEKNETYELQRFIKRKNIDFHIKVEVKEVDIPERDIESIKTNFRDEHEMIVIIQGPENGAKIFCSHDVIEHTLTSFLDWLQNCEKLNLTEISEISIYTKGLRETLEITPCAWGCSDDQAYLVIQER